MAKIESSFQFNFPLKHKSVQRVEGALKLITLYVGDLQVEGVAYQYKPHFNERGQQPTHSVDIDFIKWNGMDIKPVLEVIDALIMSDIEDAAIKHAAAIFSTLNTKEVA